MNIQHPRHHYIITRSYPSREVQRQERTGWGYLPLTIALLASIWAGYALAGKTIPQAAEDACAAYCEKEIE